MQEKEITQLSKTEIRIKPKRIIEDTTKKDINNSKAVDSYECFLKKFNIIKSDFYKFGLEETIYPPTEEIEEYWNELKKRVLNNEKVYIRGYGRDAHGTELYKKFHIKVFGNEKIFKDSTNNSKPQRLIEKLTGFRRKKTLLNYQVSHIFGMTRNALMFEAPWNIALVPKIIDPLTGHESNGMWAKEYQELFFKNMHNKYAKYIDEYNLIASKYNFENKIKEFVSEDAPYILKEYSELKKKNKLIDDLRKDFKFL